MAQKPRIWGSLSSIAKWLPLVPVIGFGFFLSRCSLDHLVRSDAPLSAEEASQKSAFTFPSSARNIYFLQFSGGLQDLELFIRLDVERVELDSVVASLFQQMNERLHRRYNPPKQPLSAANIGGPREEFLPMDWWNPASVTNGYYRGNNDPHSLKILVDEDAARIYVRQDD